MLNVAESFGFPDGTIVDFAGTQFQGQDWNFGLEDHRLAAPKLVCQHSPVLIISTDVGIDAERMDASKWTRVREHMEFVKELYNYQDEM